MLLWHADRTGLGPCFANGRDFVTPSDCSPHVTRPVLSVRVNDGPTMVDGVIDRCWNTVSRTGGTS